jgi:hypothetical protein
MIEHLIWEGIDNPSSTAFQGLKSTMTDQPKDAITAPRHNLSGAVKPITLTLEYFIGAYKVTAISNSTYYRPGEWMTPSVAQQCCDTPGWTVNMVDNTLVQTILTFGTQVGLKAVPAI